MRFLELVPCGRRAARPEVASSTPRRTEEPTNITPLTCAATEKRRRRAASDATWRPSLGVISEDRVAAAAAKGGDRTVRSGKARTGSTARISHRVNRDDYRHLGTPTVLPAFAPTAFLF